MPYPFKKKVLEAVIFSSLLYGCETWLAADFKEVERLYISAVKAVLGVRETTRNDTTLIEAGMPSVQQIIKRRTTNFLKKELNSGRIQDTPLLKIYKLCEVKRTKGYIFLSQLLQPSMQQETSVVEKFRIKNTSKARTYRTINPNMTVHKAYTSQEYIDERERLSFTRFRLGSHHLKIETGRWARIEAENRVCNCGGGIQDEHHVLFTCQKTESERRKFGVNELENDDIGVMMDVMDVHKVISFVHSCMKHFK